MYQRKSNPNGVGRKGSYTKDIPDRAYKLCLLGLKDADLAVAFGVGVSTVNYWKQHKPAFAKALKEGRMEADANVAKALYNRAIGYSHPDTVILTNRVDVYDEDGKKIETRTEPLVVDTVKHYPPSEYAAHKWLTLRQREWWAETQEHRHTHHGQIDFNHITEQISDSERFTDAELKLALKLGLNKARANTPETDD